jgi:hypothetical protein
VNNDPPTNFGARKLLKLLLWIVAVAFLLAVSHVAYKAGTHVWMFYQIRKEVDVVVKEADEGFKKAKATIDPEKLRAWALEEISKKQSTNTNPPDSEIPIYIRNLYADPPETFEVDTSTVTIYWGGGFFHWMIDIGDTNYTETTGVVENHFTTVEWVPGIYYTREDSRHPFK